MRKGVIPKISVVLGIIIFEFLAIYVFNWSGIYRMIAAGLVGVVSYSIGKKIENGNTIK